MTDLFENYKPIQVPTLYTVGGAGHYAVPPENDLDTNAFYWDKCREQFAKKFKNTTKGIFYSVSYEKINAVPHFIRDTEAFLDISEFTKYYRTNKDNVVYMQVSSFWKNCYMKRSLFTLLCRRGLEYNRKNWERFLLGEISDTGKLEIDSNYDMAKKTRNAILRFFLGFTKYVGDLNHLQRDHFPEKHGWVLESSDKNNDYIKNVLVLENAKQCPLLGRYIFGKELLLY